MKLTKISARGFKGRDAFSYDLRPINVLFGNNFRGKTRVMDAIRLALLGYLPELGNTNPATFGLASGPEMQVVAHFDNGLVITRTWSLSGNTVKKTEIIPDEIRAMGDLSVMLNAEEYFGLSDRARVEYVFTKCAGQMGMDPVAITGRVRTKALGEFPADQYEEIWKSIYDEAEAGEYMAAPEFVEVALNRFTVIYKEQKIAAVRAEKMIQQLTEMRLGDDPSPSIATLERDRAALNGQLAVLLERKGQTTGNFDRVRVANIRREAINRELEAGNKAYAEMKELTAKVEDVDRLSDMEVTPETVQAAQADVARATREWEEQSRLKSGALGARIKAEKSLGDLDSKDECPYCGAKGDGWKALRAAELATEIDAQKHVVEAQELKMAEFARFTAQATDAYNALLRRQKEQSERNDYKNQLKGRIAKLETQLARIEALAEERSRLIPDDPTVKEAADSVQAQITVKSNEQREVDREMKVLTGRQFELKRLADAEKSRDEALATVKVAEASGKELRVIQGEMVEQAFKPLLERANSFFGRTLLTDIAYHDGEIGTWRDGQWVGHRTFSGTEKALTYAAIQAALVMQSPFKIMMVDELARLDNGSADGVINAVCRAVDDGRIDGFVGIDTGRGDFYSAHASANSGLQVISIQ